MPTVWLFEIITSLPWLSLSLWPPRLHFDRPVDGATSKKVTALNFQNKHSGRQAALKVVSYSSTQN